VGYRYTVSDVAELNSKLDALQAENAKLETALRRIVSLGEKNVAKYAQATAATVTAEQVYGWLIVDVTDDGIGGVDPAKGSGLSGLADRVAALGGVLQVDSPAGGGTRVRAELPCD